MTRRAVVLMGHGSRDERGAREFLDLARAVAAASPDPVTAGVLEFAGPVAPSIQEAFDRAAALGVEEVVAQPVLLFDAGHHRYDMPEQVHAARRRHPGLRVRLGRCIGLHPDLVALADARGREAVARAGRLRGRRVALLLVGRGSFEPEANGDLFKLCRLVWERGGWAWVEGAFVSLARPFVPEGIERCVRLGTEGIVVVPFFLNTGVLVRRIYAQAAACRSRYPEVPIVCGRYLGVDPAVVRAVLDGVAGAGEPPDLAAVRAAAEARGRRGHHHHPHPHGGPHHHHHHHHHDHAHVDDVPAGGGVDAREVAGDGG